MQQLTPTGQNIVNDLALRYNLSMAAVVHMLISVNNGRGSMAQFYCPELGGSGQWMRGGMTMVGDMFNGALKMKVDNLCNDLAGALANNQMFPASGTNTTSFNTWWPASLGTPFISGSQNDSRYAVFNRHLAVETNGQVTVYDTLDNNISGVSQQQGSNRSLTFSSQYGTIDVCSLPIVSGIKAVNPTSTFPQKANFAKSIQKPLVDSEIFDSTQFSQNANASNEILELIKKLAQLKDAGIVSETEYETKKSELLARL
jgi:hypothetical protein